MGLSPLWLSANLLCLTAHSTDALEASVNFPFKDCDAPDKEFLIVLDCRRDVGIQLDRFSRVSINYLRDNRGWGNFSVTYMTSTPDGLVPLNSSDFKSLNSSSDVIERNCAREVKVDEIFEKTKNWFEPKPNTLQISFIFLNQNFSSALDDRATVRDIAERQDNELGVKRFFLIVTESRDHFAERDFLFYTPSFRKTHLVALFLAICDMKCTHNAIGYFDNVRTRSYYHTVDMSKNATFSQWRDVCRKNHSGEIAHIDSKEQLKVFIAAFLNSSQSENEKNVLVEYHNAEDRPSHNHEKSHETSSTREISSDQTCGYLRLTPGDNSSLSRGGDRRVIGGYSYEWRTFNCSDGLNNFYLACECQTTRHQAVNKSGNFARHSAVWVILPAIVQILQLYFCSV